MDLTKRLGISDDILKAATEVLEGKKISHPNQKEISAAAPPEDEITAADFKALKAKKKMHRVEGFDRNKKRYESPLFETYEEALAFYNKIRKSAPLSSLQIVELAESDEQLSEGKAYRVSTQPKNPNLGDEDTLIYAADKDSAAKKVGKLKNALVQRVQDADYKTEAKELNTANANDARAHDCAKHVVHEQWGVGETVPTMHAEPDADGKIAWYDVMFEHGIEHKVPTSALEITLSETHVHKKSKRMTEAEEHGGKTIKSLKTKELKNVIMNPEQAKEEVEIVDEMSKSMAYATGTKRAMQMTGDEPPLEKSTIKKAHKIAKAILRKEEAEQLGEAYTLKLTKTTHPKDVTDDEDQPVKATEKHYDIHQGDKKVGQVIHHHNEYGGHFFDATLHGKKVPFDRQKDGANTAKAFIDGVAKTKWHAKTVKEDTETLDEGRKAGVVGSVLSNPAAREHFKKLTGKEPSYFHISKNPEHAQAALAHAAKAKAPEGEKPAEAGDEDTEANKHPINQLRGIADRGGGKFMGKDITRAHATKLISMHDDLKPAQKLDFVSNIGKHLSKVMS